ncbi:hypothetical protein F4777DRAFT_594749 [Nemania sp. FL0916]|nr:hypothetical protein F4777DRAFT_594749 [Nemania sp. FL0916]
MTREFWNPRLKLTDCLYWNVSKLPRYQGDDENPSQCFCHVRGVSATSKHTVGREEVRDFVKQPALSSASARKTTRLARLSRIRSPPPEVTSAQPLPSPSPPLAYVVTETLKVIEDPVDEKTGLPNRMMIMGRGQLSAETLAESGRTLIAHWPPTLKILTPKRGLSFLGSNLATVVFLNWTSISDRVATVRRRTASVKGAKIYVIQLRTLFTNIRHLDTGDYGNILKQMREAVVPIQAKKGDDILSSVSGITRRVWLSLPSSRVPPNNSLATALTNTIITMHRFRTIAEGEDGIRIALSGRETIRKFANCDLCLDPYLTGDDLNTLPAGTNSTRIA